MNLYIYSVIKINKLIFEGNNIIVILKKRLTYVYNIRSRTNFKLHTFAIEIHLFIFDALTKDNRAKFLMRM